MVGTHLKLKGRAVTNATQKPPTGAVAGATSTTFKFLCSYGGKILPRHPDGKLRYLGGHTRVLAVDRSISFAELLLKLRELCGDSSVSLRCQLPTEDLDALVSIKSDEDLANLIEEYDRFFGSNPCLKIRAFLSAPRSSQRGRSSPSHPSSRASSPNSLSPNSSSSPYSSFSAASGPVLSPRIPAMPTAKVDRCVHQAPAPTTVKLGGSKAVQCACGNAGHFYLVQNGCHRY